MSIKRHEDILHNAVTTLIFSVEIKKVRSKILEI